MTETPLPSAKRDKPLLQWINSGDPDLVPVMMSDGISTAASYFGVPVRKEGVSVNFTGVCETPLSTEMVLQCSKETGISFVGCLGGVTPFDVIEFTDDVEIEVAEKVDSCGAVRRSSTLRTPSGAMSEIFSTPAGTPAFWEEHLVKSEADLAVFADLIERTNRTLVENEDARKKIIAGFQGQASKWPEQVPLFVIMGLPAFSLLSNLYMDAASGFYLLQDHRTFMERLFEIEAETNAIVLECAAQAGVDIVRGAISGLELFSPDIYERYIIPQARVLYRDVQNHGMLAWVHTCGYMKKLIDMEVYQRMGVDVLETLSHPPLGDVDNLAKAREKLGESITTRGGVNVELFYGDDRKPLAERIEKVLSETRGYRHMIGDSNDSYPPYPRENILTLVEEVQKSGRMWPTQNGT